MYGMLGVLIYMTHTIFIGISVGTMKISAFLGYRYQPSEYGIGESKKLLYQWIIGIVGTGRIKDIGIGYWLSFS